MKTYRLAFTESSSAAFRPRGAPGRWNGEGTFMVYTAEHAALAALEILAGWEVYASLQGYSLYRCTFAEALALDAPAGLDVHSKEATRAYGDAWVREAQSAALRVPSVVAPESHNVLLNPGHKDFRQIVLEPLGPFSFEERLAALVERAKG